jgi:hypothetical protein
MTLRVPCQENAEETIPATQAVLLQPILMVSGNYASSCNERPVVPCSTPDFDFQ